MSPGMGAAAPPSAVLETLRVGGLAQPMGVARTEYDFGDSGGGGGGGGEVAGEGGFGPAVERVLASAESGGGGGSDERSNKDKSGKKDKDKDKVKAVGALVIGGNFTLNGKSTNVAQYDPIRYTSVGETGG